MCSINFWNQSYVYELFILLRQTAFCGKPWHNLQKSLLMVGQHFEKFIVEPIRAQGLFIRKSLDHTIYFCLCYSVSRKSTLEIKASRSKQKPEKHEHPQPFFKSSTRHFFGFMICNTCPSLAFMEKLGISIPKFGPFYCPFLFPIEFLLFQQLDWLVLQISLRFHFGELRSLNSSRVSRNYVKSLTFVVFDFFFFLLYRLISL